MAAVDYYMCDHCGCKCFYDAELNWRETKEGEISIEGQDGLKLDMCGSIKAICLECSKTHKCEVIKIKL